MLRRVTPLLTHQLVRAWAAEEHGLVLAHWRSLLKGCLVNGDCPHYYQNGSVLGSTFQ